MVKIVYRRVVSICWKTFILARKTYFQIFQYIGSYIKNDLLVAKKYLVSFLQTHRKYVRKTDVFGNIRIFLELFRLWYLN